MTDAGRKIHAYYIEQYHGWLATQLTDISEADINTTAASSQIPIPVLFTDITSLSIYLLR